MARVAEGWHTETHVVPVGLASVSRFKMIRTSVPGPFSLKIVDATANANGFERAFTTRLCASLRAASVKCTHDSPVFVTAAPALASALGGNWSCLLLIAHGNAAASDVDSATFDVGNDSLPWWYAAALNVDLVDKAVFLCVCEALNRDSIEVLLQEQLGLILVASERSLGASEAEAFFGAILPELAEYGALSPELVKDTVDEHNHLTGGQMLVKSAVGLVGE